jgi:hypothetical protein
MSTEATQAMKDCRHQWVYQGEDILTGTLKSYCHKCGGAKQHKARKGTPAWKAQEMMRVTGRKTVTIGEGEAWWQKNGSFAHLMPDAPSSDEDPGQSETDV